MCFDICVRAVEDIIITMKEMDYDSTNESQEGSNLCNDEVRKIVEDLQIISNKLKTMKGRHKSTESPCPVCDIYTHHNHNKTEWRSYNHVNEGYDKNILLFTDGTSIEEAKKICFGLKSKHKKVASPAILK